MLEISPMSAAHTESALNMWHEQFARHLGGVFPDFLPRGEAAARAYLTDSIESGCALCAWQDGAFAGYLTWLTFDFHGDATAFCPIIGHAARSDGEDQIYRAMYQAASRAWVADGRFNHLFTTFYDDGILKDALYEIGFGAYVIDGCQLAARPDAPRDCAYPIAEAGAPDADALLSLAGETHGYYMDAPIFLRRRAFTKADIERLLRDHRILIARDGTRLIGVLDFSLNTGVDMETLTGPDSARIEGLGAYVDQAYRGKGVGSALVSEMFRICTQSGRHWVHVDYESANPFASRFWPRYFKPVFRSVRRAVNRDANR